jgi:formate--tetrahydrofolate ligase
MEFEMGQMVNQHGALLKVGLFVLVQALVYLILAQSSSVFSTTKTLGSLHPSRSLCARRMVALLSDLPLGGEPSPRAVSGGEKSYETGSIAPAG